MLEARRSFAEHLPEELKDAVAFFDADRYNAASSIQDNILFGKIAFGRSQSATQVRTLVGELINKLNLRDAVLDIGLQYQVGVAGGRLSAVQRQKAAFARALIKQPDLLVINQAFSVFDEASRTAVFDGVVNGATNMGIVAVLDHPEQASAMDRVFTVDNGRIEDESVGGAVAAEAAE